MINHGLGRVLVSPVDVVLDEKKALIVQPDIVFISRERIGIVRDRIWGAPDLVIEVLSPGTRRRDAPKYIPSICEQGATPRVGMPRPKMLPVQLMQATSDATRRARLRLPRPAR